MENGKINPRKIQNTKKSQAHPKINMETNQEKCHSAQKVDKITSRNILSL